MGATPDTGLDPTLDAELAAYVGAVIGPRTPAQDPVNLPMIRHWVEAMGIDSDVHLDADAARAAGREGPVAPAAMTQAWTQRGFRAHQALADGAGPDHDGTRLLDLLARHGYTSVVATDSDFTFERECRPGDHLSLEEVLRSVSGEKTTRLGVGRFLTSERTYRDQDDRVVAVQRWTTFRFRPADAQPQDARPEDAQPEERPLRPRPAYNDDNRFWFEAAREHRLLIQRCVSCGRLRHPPGPACPACHSLEWDTVEASGAGTVHSVTVAHHPRHPAFDYPLVVAVVELAEGTRLITNIVGAEPQSVHVGQPVRLEWRDLDDELSLPVFAPEERTH